MMHKLSESVRLTACLGLLWNWFVPTVSLVLIWLTKNPWYCLVIPVHGFIILPILDFLIGEKKASTVAQPQKYDSFFYGLLYMQIPLHFFMFGFAMYIVAFAGLPFWANLILVVTVGFNNGMAILLGHELCHKTDRMNRNLAKVALASVGFGHFLVEHTRGHHIHVATPIDCASARLGENIYVFAMREIPGEIFGGLSKEAERLKNKGMRALSVHNEVLQSYFISIVIAIMLVLGLGFWILPWVILHHLSASYMLTMVTYIEHYGLLREQGSDGKYARVTAEHSWNSNYRLSNLLLLNVQRHSDHHASPTKSYQNLDDDITSPRLPLGYPALMLLLSVPYFWFKVMNPKVAEWVDGDLNKVHIYEPHRKKLELLYSGNPS